MIAGRDWIRGILLTGLLVCLCVKGWAHSASTTFLHLTEADGRLSARLELPLRDVDEVLGLDADDDGRLTWGELRHRSGDVERWVASNWGVTAGGHPVEFQSAALQVTQHADEGYVVLHFTAVAPERAVPLRLGYQILGREDPDHRCLVRWSPAGVSDDRARIPLVLVPGRGDLELTRSESGPAGWGGFLREGVHHIWTGYDHLLFLLVLLLPGVLRQTSDGWEAVPTFRESAVAVLKVVTAFTVAHSITLALAALEMVRLPSRWVESAIAASILIAAVGNLVPTGAGGASGGARRRWSAWKLAFVFGLIHGFGFAGVLGELGLRRGDVAGPLLGFNAGVELGQLAVVAVFLPLAFWGRTTRAYRQWVLPAGSVLIAVMAGGWLVDRAFGLGFMPI